MSSPPGPPPYAWQVEDGPIHGLSWAKQEAPVERNAPAMVVLRPGDKVLVALVDDPPPEEAQEWARQLHSAFRGVEFVIAGGVAGLAVLGGGDRG